MKLKMLTLLTLFVTAMAAQADQPRTKEAAEAFLADTSIVATIKSLKADGYRIGDTVATLANAGWNEEGVEGIYLVSTYAEIGDKPYNKLNGVLTGVVVISGGHISSVKIVDTNAVAAALTKLK
jgi:hypothetical protein